MVVNDGILKAVWPHSGHYHPTEQAFMSFLRENNVDLTNSPDEEDGEALAKVKRITSRIRETEEETYDFLDAEIGENPNAKAKNHSELQTLTRFHSKLSNPEIPNKENDIIEDEPGTPSEQGYETAEETFIAED